MTSSVLYRTLWRWHFYAGLFCLPFVLLLSISGAIYLFKPQIDAWVEAPLRQLPGEAPVAPANAQLGAARAALPGSHLISYRLPENVDDAVAIMLRWQEEAWLVYVHPRTLSVLKTTPVDDQFIRLVRAFHGELLAGDVGSILVELAACWALVLMVTGLYLWWPRDRRGLAGVLYPRLRAGGRLFWRDLHAVTGIWIAAFTLFLLLTALPWTLVWGSAFKELRQWYEHGTAAQDWSLRSGGDHADHGAVVNRPHNEVLPEAVVVAARQLRFAPPVNVSPQGDHWAVKSFSQNRPLRSDAVMDSHGRVLRVVSFADRPLLDRVIGVGVAAHEGQLFGWFNQLLGLLTAAGLSLLAISGFVMWYRRRPSNVLGAYPPAQGVGRVVAAIVLVFSLMLPLLLVSLVSLLLLEWAVLRRVPMMRRWLGLAA